VTPQGGTVLDCFLGSGSTALAAELEGFQWVGIEKEPEYVKIAEARLNGTQRGLGLDVPAPTARRNGGPDTYVADTEYLNATRPKARYQPWKEMDGRKPKEGA
jgi:hypothetical protein